MSHAARRKLVAATVAVLSLAAPAGAEPPPPEPEPSDTARSSTVQQAGGSTEGIAGWEGSPAELDEALEKWASEYVLYIMTDQERAIYEGLGSREEKLAFIDRFWELRDPTPGTAKNEYRDEHFARFTTATRLFAAGKPGWATDRGRIYILLGPPHQIQRNPTGRRAMERSSVVWTYNGIDNPRLPASLDLPFVDFHGTGEFELVSNLDMSAAIVNDQFGYINSNLDAYALARSESVFNDPSGVFGRQRDPTLLAQDYLEFFRELREIERVPEIHLERLASLRESVAGTVRFDSFAVPHSVSYYEAEGGRTAADITVALDYEQLRYTEVATRFHYSADVYVALQEEGVVVAEDERRLNFALAYEQWEAVQEQSILQPLQLTAPPGVYELVVLVRDNPSERIGQEVRPVHLPDLSGPGLRVSSLTLAARVERSRDAGDSGRLFDKGDLRVVPNVRGVYYPGQNLMLYVQAYGLALDPDKGTNRVAVQGRIEKDGERFREIPPVYPYPNSRDRMALSLGVPLRDFPAGSYTAIVEVVDRHADTSETVTASFKVARGSGRGR